MLRLSNLKKHVNLCTLGRGVREPSYTNTHTTQTHTHTPVHIFTGIAHWQAYSLMNRFVRACLLNNGDIQHLAYVLIVCIVMAGSVRLCTWLL